MSDPAGSGARGVGGATDGRVPGDAVRATGAGAGRVRDRRVLMLLAACVLAVLGLDVLSAYVPGLDSLLTRAPVLVVVLVVATVGVLLWSVGRRRRA